MEQLQNLEKQKISHPRNNYKIRYTNCRKMQNRYHYKQGIIWCHLIYLYYIQLFYC